MQVLKDSEIRYRRLFEAAQDGILILDAQTGMIEDVNPYLIQMLGYSREEFLKRKLWEVGAFRDIEASKDAFEALQVDEFIRYDDLPLKAKNGTLVNVEFVSNVYLVGNEKVIQCNIRNITERKFAEEKIQRQLEHLIALSAIDRAITSNFDLKFSLKEVLENVTKELRVDAADILIFNPNIQMLEYGAEQGFRTNSVKTAQVRLGESYAGRVAMEGRLIQISSIEDEPDNLLLSKFLKGEDFVCYYGAPLIVKGQIKGVLEVFHRTKLDPDTEWFDFLNTLASHLAIAVDNAALFESLQRSNAELTLAYDATIEGWSHALDLRDKETEGHSLRVTELTVELARAFGLNDAELVQVRWGSLLHDIGKMGVPDAILFKPGVLSDDEWIAMKKHPVFAYEMLSPIRYLRLALDIPYCHHEKWDGSGYPRSLKGDQIPVTARIFAVVDVWDALISERPYRIAWTIPDALKYIQASSEIHFDPQVVNLFLDVIGRKLASAST
ncbi:MAG: HD domain-containing protein [Anaerolineales bacterium]|uniref:HD domain-containing phosphohydrolase n=1 Tax=Candidatus Villigracilis vicinus TaxID=3140679 RepID=UPI0031362F33|nr:HD domain-containing protein [Anaerolineales bacterium]